MGSREGMNEISFFVMSSWLENASFDDSLLEELYQKPDTTLALRPEDPPPQKRHKRDKEDKDRRRKEKKERRKKRHKHKKEKRSRSSSSSPSNSEDECDAQLQSTSLQLPSSSLSVAFLSPHQREADRARSLQVATNSSTWIKPS